MNKNQKLSKNQLYNESIKSFYKIKDKMIEYDNEIHELYNKKPELFKIPNFRYYSKKNNNNLKNVDNIYLTSVFLSESYIPGALVLAYSLKNVKSKYPVVCMVQDKPYEEEGIIKFEGLSKDSILKLLEVFDMVIGVDLLKIKNYIPSKLEGWSEKYSSYNNMLYYITKAHVLAFTQFKKICYFDSSNYVVKNIDNIFKENNLSTFLNDWIYEKIKIGYHGALALIIPNKIQYYKLMSFTNNYKKFFGDLYFFRMPDEVMTFFAIFPHWNPKLLEGEMKCTPKFKNYKKHQISNVPIDKLILKNQNYCFTQHFAVYKPFKNKPAEYKNSVFSKMYLLFVEWDKLANKLIKKHPNLKIYFEHIPKIRKQFIFDNNNKIEKQKKEKIKKKNNKKIIAKKIDKDSIKNKNKKVLKKKIKKIL